LIKKRIERVLVPGFQPSGATVAAIMGDEPARRRKDEPEKRRKAEPKRAGADPIFSKPYEPSAPPAEAPKPAEPPQKGKRKQPQVAALLGGLRKA
jgi:hypothetical protein